jgi:hypothetical protein
MNNERIIYWLELTESQARENHDTKISIKKDDIKFYSQSTA